MHHKNYFGFSVLIIVILILGSCTSANTESIVSPTAVPITETASKTALPLTATASRVPSQTRTIKPTLISTSTKTPLPTFPVSTPIFLGTPISAGNEVINSENIHRLTHIAQWGRGMILGTAFTPDGSKFVVGSAFGLAVYDVNDLQTVPTWIPFDTPINYTDLIFTKDGKFLRLAKGDLNVLHLANEGGNHGVLDFLTSRFVSDPGDQTWINTVARAYGYGKIIVDSPDGIKRFTSQIGDLKTEDWIIEDSIREVHDLVSGEILYTLPDETFYLTFNDVHQPESCDLSSTAVCGNVYVPTAFAPYEGCFSPTGDTLTLLYRAPNYGNSNRYSVLRIYDAQNGTLLSMVGSFEKPVQTFAYAPNSNYLLIAYVDGSLQFWDIRNNKPTSGAWHFNDYVGYAEFTADDRYLILRRPEALEIRSTREGSLRSRYKMVSYTLSPADSNIMAIADKNNVIKIIEIDSGKTILSIPAHEYKILAIEFSPDGRYIASSGQDCTVKLWDAQTGQFLHYFEDTKVNGYEGGSPSEETGYWGSRIFIYSMYFIEGTSQIVGFGSWGTMVNWNVNSGATNYVVYSAPLDFYNGMMTVSPHYPGSFGVDMDNQQFHIGNTIYNLQNGVKIGEYQRPASIPENCSSGGLVSADGNLKFTLGYERKEGQVCVLDVHDNHLVQLITVIPDPDYDLYVAGLSLSHDGKTLIVATTMGTVNVYQITR